MNLKDVLLLVAEAGPKARLNVVKYRPRKGVDEIECAGTAVLDSSTHVVIEAKALTGKRLIKMEGKPTGDLLLNGGPAVCKLGLPGVKLFDKGRVLLEVDCLVAGVDKKKAPRAYLSIPISIKQAFLGKFFGLKGLLGLLGL